MHASPDLAVLVVLGLVGVVAGFINTIAGAGSLLTIPALLLTGMPADAANATNRVGVLAQSAGATIAFDRRGKLDRKLALTAAVPASFGALGGAFAALRVPEPVLRWVLVGTMVLVAIAMVRPAPVRAKAEVPRHPVLLALALFAVGFYGGFLQAGVGLVLLAVLMRGFGLELAHANGVKLTVVGIYTVVALLVFSEGGAVRWLEGLVLSVGAVSGGQLGVHLAVRPSKRVDRFVVALVVLACVAVVLREVLR